MASKRTNFKRQNTITLNIYESQNNINHLLAELESHHLNNSNREIAFVQANITDLMGKFQDSQNDLRGDLMDILESFQKGTMSAEELGALLQGEKERGSLSIKLVEEIQSNLEDIISFVAHFVHDVEQGKPLPKQSFQSLFRELDIVSDSVNSMSKVVRTPNKKVREIKAKIGNEVENRMEKSRGIGSGPTIATFIQQKKEETRHVTINENRGGQRREDTSVKSNDQQPQPQSQPQSQPQPVQSAEKITSNKIQIAPLSDRANTPSRVRRGVSFRSLSRSPSREYEGSEEENNLGLQGKKSNLASHKTSLTRQRSKVSSKSSVRSIPPGDSDDDLSFDSGQDSAIREVVVQTKKTLKCHRQTQTDEIVPDFLPIDRPSSSQTSKKGGMEARPRLSSLTNQPVPTQREGSPERQLKLQGQSAPKPFEKRGSTYFPISEIPVSQKPVVILSDVQMNAPIVSKIQEETSLLPSKRPLTTTIEEIKFGGSMEYEEANRSAKELEEEVKKSGSTDALQKYLSLKENRLNQLELSLKLKESNIDVLVQQQVKLQVENIRMEFSEKEKNFVAMKNDSESKMSNQPPAPSPSPSVEKVEKGSKGSVASEKSQDTKKGAVSRSVTKQSTKTSLKSEENSSSTPNTVSSAPSIAPASSILTAGPSENRDFKASLIRYVHQSARKFILETSDFLAETQVPPPDHIAKPHRQIVGKQSVSDKKEDLQKVIKTILSFLPKPEPSSSERDHHPPSNNRHYHPPTSNRKNTGTLRSRDLDIPKEIEIPHPLNHLSHPGTNQLSPMVIGQEKVTKDGGHQRKDNKVSQHGNQVEEQKRRLSHSQLTALSQNLHHDDPSPEQFSSIKMIGTTLSTPGDGSHAGSHGPRGRAHGQEGGGLAISDDESGFTYDRTERALNGNSEDRTRTITSEINEIWVPPPSSLVKRRLPSTIVIFPLNTIDSSTSTDDLPISSPLPLSLPAPEINTEPIQATTPSSSVNPPKSAQSTVPLDRIQSDLAASNMPLTLLYQHFFPYLSVLSRHHLMAAAAGELTDMSKEADSSAPPKKSTPLYSTHSFASLFEIVHEEMSKLEYTSYHALESVPYCEQLIGDLVILVQAKQPVNDDFLASLREVTRLIGELEIAEAWVDMLLTNSRTIFNRIRALSIHPSIIGENYQKAYSAFLSCQGTNVALKHKLTSLQKDIQTYLHQPMIILQQDHSTSHKKLQQQLQRLVQHCEQLEETLGDTTDELEELRDQYLLLQQEKDSTPGTLLFFSILSITKLPEILTSHITSLGHIKELINGSEHFDYMKLRKYLENSCQALPQFQQLLKKYSTLYKKWIQQRSKIFFEKKLIGANADQHFICPLCSHDNRDDILGGGATPSGLSPKFGVGGIGAGGGMKPMLQSLQSYVYPTPGVGSSQGLRKGTAMKGVSRGMISSRSLNAPLGSIIR